MFSPLGVKNDHPNRILTPPINASLITMVSARGFLDLFILCLEVHQKFHQFIHLYIFVRCATDYHVPAFFRNYSFVGCRMLRWLLYAPRCNDISIWVKRNRCEKTERRWEYRIIYYREEKWFSYFSSFKAIVFFVCGNLGYSVESILQLNKRHDVDTS